MINEIIEYFRFVKATYFTKEHNNGNKVKKAHIKSTSIYMRNKHYYIMPYSQTTVGLYIGVEPITVLDDNVSDKILGKSIVDSFAFSKEEIPNPSDSDNVAKPLLKAAKVKSWRAFMSGSESISFENIDGVIKLLPWVNGGAVGPGRGFRSNGEKDCILSADCSAAELGKTVKKMFQDIKEL
ncbi:MAG: CdiI family contact-dependent growth inhibition immunity protein [Fibromonadaceae bacterium]|jgi:hypothetical protein|nr:CdiI family contact-dependent growth inhibition immunity protein [Fibromonadaceae bacterium]